MKITIFRRIVQILSILLIIAIPILNKKGITILMGSLYSLALGPVWVTDPLSGFQVILSTLSVSSVLLISMAIPIVLAVIFGRVFCSYMCPQNAMSELFDFISEKMKIRRAISMKPYAIPRYVVMIILLLLTLLLGFPVSNLISAPGIISVQIAKYVYEGVIGIELTLIGIILVSEVFLVRRVWCNYICPVGSFLGLFRFNKTMKVVYKEDTEHTCGRCLECVRACQLGLNPMEGKIYPLCHNCGDCISVCERIKGKTRPLMFRF